MFCEERKIAVSMIENPKHIYFCAPYEYTLYLNYVSSVPFQFIKKIEMVVNEILGVAVYFHGSIDNESCVRI